MKSIFRKRIECRKRRIERRLDKCNFPDDLSQPVMQAPTPHYELAGRAVVTALVNTRASKPSSRGPDSIE